MRIKGLLKKALAAVTSAALALSFVTAESVSAEGEEYIYKKTVSIEQILADFQYFVQTDADVSMHQVGSLYVGGTAQIGSFGDGAMVNSYVKDLACITSTNFGAYLPPALKKYKSETLYVGNTREQLESNYNVPGWMYLYNPYYIKPTTDKYVADDTFANLAAVSRGYADAAQSANVTKSGDVITIDVTTVKKATIPASIVDSNTKILFKGIDSAEDFGNDAIIVSFIGVNDSTFDLNSNNIFFKEIAEQNNLRTAIRALGTSKGDVQILCEGAYKLIWNFPDAEGKITCGAFSGHIVAPLAYVTADEGGAFVGAHEGGIIAKSVSAHNSQGHFYPFYPLADNPPTPIDETTKNVVILKAFEVNGAGTTDVPANVYENTVFTLQDTDPAYPDVLEACPAKVTTTVGGVTSTRFEVIFLSKGGKIKAGHKYIIKEKQSAGGFVKSDDVWYALVPEMGSAEKVKFSSTLDGTYTDDVPVFTNTKTTYNFSFTKTDGTDPLAGAEFTLYNGTVEVAVKTSAANGKVSFENIEAGTYTLKETSVPAGYEDNTAVYNVTVAASGVTMTGDDTLSGTVGAYKIKNTQTPAPIPDVDNIELIKTYQDADFSTMSAADITALLNGTEFTLYDGTTPVDTQKPVKSGNSGKVTFSTGIQCGKLYKIAETSAPAGYDQSTAVWYAKVADDGKVTYSATETGTFTSDVPAINNTLTVTPPIPTPAADNIELIKTYQDADFTAMSDSEINALLNGTEFTLYDGTTAVDTQKPVKSGNGGKVTFSTGIQCGKLYKIAETAAPAGYDVSTAVWYAKVADDGKVTYSATETGTFTADVPAINNILTTTPPTPTPTADNIELIKTYQDADFTAMSDSEINALLNGTEFTIYDGTTPVDTQKPVKSGTSGKVTFSTGIQCGKLYKIAETAAPTGYDVSTAVWYAKVADDGKVTYSDSETGTFTSDVPAINNILTVTPPVPTPTADNIELIKTYQDADFTAMSDSEINALFNGTEFTLYDGTTPVDTQKPVKSGNSGKVTFSTGIQCGKLYKITETAAPAGYDVSTAVWYAKVADDGKVTYSATETGTFTSDVPAINNILTVTPPTPVITNVEFTKVSSDTLVALEGAIFGLYTDSSCTDAIIRNGVHYTVQSGDDGVVRFEGLTAGTFYFKELVPPAGYAVNPAVYSVTITFEGGVGRAVFNNGLTQLAVQDDPISPAVPGAVQVIKVYRDTDVAGMSAAERDALLNSTVFTMYRADNTVAGVKTPVWDGTKAVVTFDANVTFDTLYRIRETAAPDGYNISEAEWYAYVDDNGAVTYGLTANTAAFTADVPVFENIKRDDDPSNAGDIIITPNPIRYPPYVPPYTGTPYLSKDDTDGEDVSSEAGLDEESDGAVHTDTAAYGAIVLTMLASAAVIIAARKRRQK